MNIPKDVIIDLMPLYQAGEVSAETRRFVEAYLQQHPEFERPASEPADIMLKGVPPASVERGRREALERTRALLIRRQTLFGIALGCTLMTFAFAFEGSRVTWFMWRDAPGPAGALMGVAIGCWIGFIKARRELRVAGM